MTTIPPAPDHPDFSPDSIWTPTALAYESGNLSADKVYGPFYVGNYGALSVGAFGLDATVGWSVFVQWFADVNATQPIDSITFQSVNGTEIAAALPNRGPVVKVTLGASSYASSRAYSFFVYPRLVHETGAGPLGSGLLFKSLATNIVAGGNPSLGFTTLTTVGRATLSVLSTATSWSAAVYGYDRTSTLQTLAAALDPGSGRSGSVVFDVPPLALQVFVQNYNAGLQTFNVGIVAEV